MYNCSVESCGTQFEVSKFMCDASTPEVCPECGKHADRDWSGEGKTKYFKGPVKTLGSIRDKNTDTFSSDYREHLKVENETHNSRIEKKKNAN